MLHWAIHYRPCVQPGVNELAVQSVLRGNQTKHTVTLLPYVTSFVTPTESSVYPMHRRSYLTTLATGVLGCAGCAHEPDPDGSAGGVTKTFTLKMTPVTDTEIAHRVTRTLDDGPQRKIELTRQIVTNGSATVQAAEPPLPRINLVTYNGTVYALSSERSDPQTAYRYQVEFNSVESIDAGTDTVAVEDLPEVDRRKINPTVIDAGTQLTYTATERNRSELVPTPTASVIVWDTDNRAQVTVKESTTDTSQATYHYTATARGSATEYGRSFRKDHQFSFSGLTDAEREIIEEATPPGQGYSLAPTDKEPEATPTPAVIRLVERFRNHIDQKISLVGEPTPRVGGRYLVQYKGDVFWTLVVVDDDEF